MAGCGRGCPFMCSLFPPTIKRGRVGVMTEVTLSLVAVCMVWFFAYAIHFMVTTWEDEEE